MEKTKKSFKWIRTEKCNPKKCGSFCCRIGTGIGVNLEHEDFSKSIKRDTTKYGNYYDFFGMKDVKTNKKIVYFLNKSCKFLSIKGKCEIYKERPYSCKVFPEDPTMEFFKPAKKAGCTYKFKKKFILDKKKV